jgi:inosine/xanthosine triphosphate pyrophosphatase family protein
MLPDLGKSLAELSMDEKNRLSHRGVALEAFRRFIKGD